MAIIDCIIKIKHLAILQLFPICISWLASGIGMHLRCLKPHNLTICEECDLFCISADPECQCIRPTELEHGRL